MAKVRDNPILDGLSGKLGKRIFIRKGRGGRTIVGLLPAEYGDREYSDSELQHQEEFKDAVDYAKDAKDNPLYQELAKDVDPTAFNLAVADWFGKPVVVEIDASEWTGKAGEVIHVRAKDNFRVERVHLQIDNGNGTLYEQGLAVQGEKSWWRYTTKTDVSLASSPRILATARDLPGRSGELVWQNN